VFLEATKNGTWGSPKHLIYHTKAGAIRWVHLTKVVIKRIIN
jgi:hypothetical protein